MPPHLASDISLSKYHSLRNIVAVVIGNALEWYDFTVFGFMSVIIAQLFFPSTDPYSSLLLATASFGVAFFMRPFGGVLLGLYADRAGRKAALTLVMGLMTIGIALLAFTPTYATIGIAAPLMIVIARLLQGFSAGGEFGSATAFLIEIAPPSKRGFYSSWQISSQMIALLLGSLVGAIVTHHLSQTILYDWGWRLPFIIGLVIGPIGFYVRQHLHDPPVFLAQHTAIQQMSSFPTNTVAKPSTISLRHVCRNYPRAILCGLGLVVAPTMTVYVLFIYLPTFTTTQLKLSMNHAFFALIVGSVLLMLLSPVMGMWSDRIKRQYIALGSLIMTLVLIYPLFKWLITAPSVDKLILVIALLSITLSGYYGTVCALMSELFPIHVRSTCMSISYNFGVMLFGGFGPFFVTWLLQNTGSLFASTYYTMAGLFFSIFAVLFIPNIKEATL